MKRRHLVADGRFPACFFAALPIVALGNSPPSGKAMHGDLVPAHRHRIPISIPEERKLQRAMDEGGHQPWRLDPMAVAVSTLGARIGKFVREDACRELTVYPKKIVVRCVETSTYDVVLRRLARSDGIWTVVEIDDM